MSDPKAFNCPSCGGPLTITGSEVEVVCPYCGTHVLVPEELRSKPAAPVAPQPIVQPEVIIVPQYTMPSARPYRARRSGCGGLVFMLLILAGVIGYVLRANPGLIGELSGQMVPPKRTSAPANAYPGAILTGDFGSGPGHFSNISHFAVDPAGHFFISESSTFRIQKFDASGKYIGSWDVDSGNSTTGPNDLAADNNGNIYAVEDSAILKYDNNGKQLGKYTDLDKYGAGDHYEKIAVSPQGSLWAITFGNGLLHLDSQGKILDRIADPISSQFPGSNAMLASVDHLTIDKSGNIYMLASDTVHEKVLVFSPDGKKLLAKFGDSGDTPGKFKNPQAIAVDDQGRVYVSQFNGLQVLDSQGRYLRNLPLRANTSPQAMQYDGKGSLFVVIDWGINKFDVSSTAAQ